MKLKIKGEAAIEWDDYPALGAWFFGQEDNPQKIGGATIYVGRLTVGVAFYWMIEDEEETKRD